MDQNQFEGSLNELSGKVETAAGNLTGDSKLQAEGRVDQGLGKFEQGYARARDTLRDVVGDVSGQARTAAASAQATAGNIGQALEENVHARPLLALAAAGALGYLIAFLVHRK